MIIDFLMLNHRLEGKRPMHNSASNSRGSIPLTEDGYAVLEPEDCTECGHSNTGGSISKENIDQTNYHDQNESKVNILSGHSELSENFRNEHDHDYEEPYWEPANKEEELMDQLSRLGVPEILVESIEYVLAITPALMFTSRYAFFTKNCSYVKPYYSKTAVTQ